VAHGLHKADAAADTGPRTYRAAAPVKHAARAPDASLSYVVGAMTNHDCRFGCRDDKEWCLQKFVGIDDVEIDAST
jgi:hypothetical protein